MIKYRYLFPRKIKYTMHPVTDDCMTPCPVGGATFEALGEESHPLAKVGSLACEMCDYNKGNNWGKQYVLCVRKPRQKKLIEGAL